jgi:hypothetical protein
MINKRIKVMVKAFALNHGTGSLLVMEGGFKQGQKRRDCKNRGTMEKSSLLLGEDWVESI